MKKTTLLIFMTLSLFVQVIAQNTKSYYNLESYSQYDITEKENSYAKYTWDTKTIKVETYKQVTDKMSVANYDITSQKKLDNGKEVILAKRVSNEVLEAEIKGNLYLAFVYQASIYHKNFIDVIVLDKGLEKDFEDITKNDLSIAEKGDKYTLVEANYFEEVKKTKGLTGKTSKKDFIKVLKRIKNKMIDLQKEYEMVDIEENAFMVGAILESSFNGFASKDGFGELLDKYKPDEEVKALFDEIMKLRKED